MAETTGERRIKVEVKIDGKLGSGQPILRQEIGDENMELTICHENQPEMTFCVGTAELARVVEFLVHANRKTRGF